jgi:hypothetical protein
VPSNFNDLETSVPPLSALQRKLNLAQKLELSIKAKIVKVKKFPPPLKDIPDEIYPDSGDSKEGIT